MGYLSLLVFRTGDLANVLLRVEHVWVIFVLIGFVGIEPDDLSGVFGLFLIFLLLLAFLFYNNIRGVDVVFVIIRQSLNLDLYIFTLS